MTTMKNKPISFNLDNPSDKQLFDHVKDIKNFSAYAKSLIAQDIQYKRNVIRVEVGKK
ncbi:hypothetical protein GLV94_05440 [Virgibacillus halodenitrificans]|uniref:hypothetical protein n=1 Tax=Virgibacillus halodenitrificans TaxID=1482 RepID=UPI0013720DEA|nr:hypothetical protein [Virgibacillus halodenitrificans]MYL45079.1 hypothetical protein [Virgibacillus halodenitrificans]